MEGELLKSNTPSEYEFPWETFDRLCPYYLHLGMTIDQYWNGAPELTKYFREKHRLDREAKNQELWLQGLYFHKAVSIALANAFSRKGARTHNYPDKPIDIFGENEKNVNVEKERRKAVNFFDNLKKSFEAKQALTNGIKK